LYSVEIEYLVWCNQRQRSGKGSMSEREDRSQYCNGAYKDVADVIGKWCTHKIGSDDGGSKGGTRATVQR